MQTKKPACLTTLTIFKLKSGYTRWGLAQMGTSAALLRQVPGLQFFKLMGSGHGKGFSILPNLNRYGLLCTWQSNAAAEAFFSSSDFFTQYQARCEETWTVQMLPYQSHGLWDGQAPFAPTPDAAVTHGPVAVLTRASINWLALPSFWKFVPKTSQALNNASGLLSSIGLGELPLVRQATFSVWESVEAMRRYAYQTPFHQEVMRRTKAQNWYSEELFARFKPLASDGNWHGHDPLQELVPKISVSERLSL